MSSMTVPPQHESFRLPPGLIALALALKYLGLFCYGIHAAIFGVTSFVIVGGEAFALVWGLLVAALSVLAFIGVARTWQTGRATFEKQATAALIVGFLLYSIVLFVRCIITNDWDSSPLVWLPPILSIFPTIRYYWLVFKAEHA